MNENLRRYGGPPRPSVREGGPGGLFWLLLLLLGCGGEAPAPPVPAQVYTVRGLVRQVPVAGRPASELLIHHEAIPDFVDDRGRTVGMESMSMPFPVADPALLEGIAPGDRVELELRVQWRGSPPVVIDRLEKLADGTRLSFERPAEPGGDE